MIRQARTVDRETLAAWELLARDPKYAHFTHIPDRIIRCLKYFEIKGDAVEIRKRLHAYYLFIGVTDEAMDSGEIDLDQQILRRIRSEGAFDQEPHRVGIVIDVLRENIAPEIQSDVFAKLEELYRTVVDERDVDTIKAYIQKRKVVGSLTAEISYLIIRPFLTQHEDNFRLFVRRVGSIGCLVDSVIDLRADAKLGLVSFKPTARASSILIANTFVAGLGISFKHPQLVRVFAEAVIDNVRDRFRGASKPATRFYAAPKKEGVPSVS